MKSAGCKYLGWRDFRHPLLYNSFLVQAKGLRPTHSYHSCSLHCGTHLEPVCMDCFFKLSHLRGLGLPYFCLLNKDWKSKTVTNVEQVLLFLLLVGEEKSQKRLARVTQLIKDWKECQSMSDSKAFFFCFPKEIHYPLLLSFSYITGIYSSS